MKYKISEKRSEFLRDKFFEYSFKENELDTKTLDSISEPVELNFIAKNHNYDDGNEILIHLVNNPNCDLSTVKMIFFRADLDGFLKTKENSEDFELINSIIQNCKNELYKNENFHYNPDEDFQLLEFDFEEAKNYFPSILFGKPKGKRLEPNFAEKFQQRNISTYKEKIQVKKTSSKFNISGKSFEFEFTFPEDFEIVQDKEINKIVESYNFPDNLQNTFHISENQLKKVVIKPEIVIKRNGLTIILFAFNSQSLFLENALTNVFTIMRNEFVYIQAFFKIVGVEEDFDKIKRIKYDENWFALSKGMQIKIENMQKDKFLKLLLVEVKGLLFYFTILSNSFENIENENIQNLIIERIKIKKDYS